jgi:hypothetical protein
MNYRNLLLVFLLCTAAVPAMIADSNYMGGDIVLGGAGPRQVTQVTLAITEATTAAVPVQAQQATGSLSVTTSPAGATIIIDGTQRGVSPATIPGLSAGSHALLLKMNGYQDLSAPITVTAGQTQTYTTGLSPVATAAAATPALPRNKTPGFEAFFGIAALGAVLVIRKSTR